MARKKKDSIEYRYYEMAVGEYVLALYGDEWIREYGTEEEGLHFHNLLEIGICRDGSGSMRYDEEKIPYQTGTITIIPANLPHTTIGGKSKKIFWEYLFLDPALLLREIYPDNKAFQEQVLAQLNKTHLTYTSDSCPQLYQMINLLIYEMAHKEKHYRRVTKGLCEALVMELYRLCMKEKSELPLRYVTKSNLVLLNDALEYINKHYQDSSLKIETLADVCGLSETHFRRIFKEQTNMSPSEYVNLVRIQAACEWMRKSNMSMEELSGRIGFESSSSFIRNFKKLLGITPYKWKKHPENYEGKLQDYNISVFKGW